MNHFWITLAGQKISVIDDVDMFLKVPTTSLTLPCLAGEDVTREYGKICVMWTREHGIMLQENYRDISVEQGSTLMGWGALDGMSVVLRPEECAWTVDVNADLWHAANDWAKHHVDSLVASEAPAAA